MKYVLKPSLQQMALVKIAAELWNQDDIREEIKNFAFNFERCGFYCEWPRIETQVEQKVSRLPTPESLKKNLLRIIWPIGHQIKAWCKFHHGEQRQISRLPKQFSWIPRGTIDWKGTAEMFVKEEDIDDKLRYDLTRLHCLGNEIQNMWKRPPMPKYRCTQIGYYPLQLFGRFSNDDEESRQSSPHVYAIELAIRFANPVATEFFFDKLSDEERDTLLVECSNCFFFPSINDKSRSTVSYFLFSHMTEDQQIKALTMFPRYIFQYFLDWPFQPFFMLFAEPTMNFINSFNQGGILGLITTKIVDGWTDFDYRQLFRDYWRLMPLAHKRDSVIHFEMLESLLLAGEVEILELLLNEADAIEKEKLILSVSGRFLCEKLIDESKWDLLEFFIERCVPSKEVRIQFKEERIERHAINSRHGIYKLILIDL